MDEKNNGVVIKCGKCGAVWANGDKHQCATTASSAPGGEAWTEQQVADFLKDSDIVTDLSHRALINGEPIHARIGFLTTFANRIRAAHPAAAPTSAAWIQTPDHDGAPCSQCGKNGAHVCGTGAAPDSAQQGEDEPPLAGDVVAAFSAWMHSTSTAPHNNDRRPPFDAFKAGAEWHAHMMRKLGDGVSIRDNEQLRYMSFVEAGQPIPVKDEHTADLFAEGGAA